MSPNPTIPRGDKGARAVSTPKLILPGVARGQRPDNPRDITWVSGISAEAGSREHELLVNLRTVSTYVKEAWLELARIYRDRYRAQKDHHDLYKAAAAYIGTMYVDCHDDMLAFERFMTLGPRGDQQIKREFTECYVSIIGLAHESEREQMVAPERVIAAVPDVAVDPARLGHELQHILYSIERRDDPLGDCEHDPISIHTPNVIGL